MERETSTLSPSSYTTSDALKAKICLGMKCVTSHYWQGRMVELPELMVMLAVDSKIAVGITIGFTKLTYSINYVWKRYFLEKCMRLVKDANHLTVSFDNSLNHISYCKQLDTYVLYFNEIAS